MARNEWRKHGADGAEGHRPENRKAVSEAGDLDCGGPRLLFPAHLSELPEDAGGGESRRWRTAGGHGHAREGCDGGESPRSPHDDGLCPGSLGKAASLLVQCRLSEEYTAGRYGPGLPREGHELQGTEDDAAAPDLPTGGIRSEAGHPGAGLWADEGALEYGDSEGGAAGDGRGGVPSGFRPGEHTL